MFVRATGIRVASDTQLSFYGIDVNNTLISLGSLANGDIDLPQSPVPIAMLYYEFDSLNAGKIVVVVVTGSEVVA